MHNLRRACRARHAVHASLVAAVSVACATVPKAPAPPPQATNVLEVEVLTSVDTLARFARVRAAFDGTPTTLVMSRGPSGRFVAAIPRDARRVALTVSVPDHGVLETQATLPTERPAVFRVRPRPLIPAESLTNVRVVGDFNGFKERASDRLLPTVNGRLRVAIPFTGDSSRFLILGVGGPSDAAWMPARSYAIAPDSANEATFAGFARPIRDSLIFEIEPAQLRYRQTPALLQTITADSALNVANALAMERIDALRHSGVLPYFRPSERDSTRARLVTHARGLLSTVQDPRVRTEALVTVISAWGIKDPWPVAESRALLAENGPESPITRDLVGIDAIAQAIVFAQENDGATAEDSIRWQQRIVERSREYLLPAARDVHAGTPVRSSAYSGLVHQIAATKARAGLDSLIAEAIAALPNDPYLARLPAAFGSHRALRPGIAFPAFRLASLDSSGAEINNASFHGKLTLVDFWATWCAPCVEEMPVLQRAHERFKGRRFAVLSVSADANVRVVAKWRREKWPMPWLHAWSGTGPNTPALEALGVVGFPTAVLVDGAGKIIAVNEGLRGAALERTLEKLLP
jgi:thiol-disulfide isomerase/thioredoxin